MTATTKHVRPAPGTVVLRPVSDQFVSGILVDYIADADVNKKTGASIAELVFEIADGTEQSFMLGSWGPSFALVISGEYTCESKYGTRTDGTVGTCYRMEQGLGAFEPAGEDI
jgi:hypothetical protein